MPEFDSQGFDLDKLASATDDVVLELTGNLVRENEPDPMTEAEEWKQKGNDAFKGKEWGKAYELYGKAIASTPGMTGDEILALEATWKEERQQRVREELRQRNETKKPKSEQKGEEDDVDDTKKSEQPNNNNNDPPPKFQLPLHPHGDKLSVYYGNRAAASLQMGQEEMGDAPPPKKSAFDDDDNSNVPANSHLKRAVEDCHLAILLNPKYVKALVRRSTAYERMGDTEHALIDAKEAQTLEPYNSAGRMAVSRLQKIEDERMEQLKTETLGKLKDLGNSVLSNFGLSLDNFQAVQDPNTGSYSISFNQSK
jgi:tetratricopeptide (TPR) repeat protein